MQEFPLPEQIAERGGLQVTGLLPLQLFEALQRVDAFSRHGLKKVAFPLQPLMYRFYGEPVRIKAATRCICPGLKTGKKSAAR